MFRPLVRIAAVLAATVFAAPAAAQSAPAAGSAAPGPWRSSLVADVAAARGAVPAVESRSGAGTARGVSFAIMGAGIGGFAGFSLGSSSCDGDPPSAATCVAKLVAFGAMIGAVCGWHLAVDRSPHGTRISASHSF